MQLNSPEERTSLFTPNELAYLQSQQLCRIATVAAGGQPHVMPVGFHYDPETETFIIGGRGGFAKRKRWRDVQQNPQVAIVIDDIASYNPWRVRGIEIRGTAETLLAGGEAINPIFDREIFRITPRRIVSWGIDTDAYSAPNARSVNP